MSYIPLKATTASDLSTTSSVTVLSSSRIEITACTLTYFSTHEDLLLLNIWTNKSKFEFPIHSSQNRQKQKTQNITTLLKTRKLPLDT